MTPTEPITVTISHRLGRDEAKRRLERGFDTIRGELGPFVKTLDHRWDDYQLEFRVSAMMQAINGRIEVYDESVRIELVLPGFLHLAGKAIAGRIKNRGLTLLQGPPPR